MLIRASIPPPPSLRSVVASLGSAFTSASSTSSTPSAATTSSSAARRTTREGGAHKAGKQIVTKRTVAGPRDGFTLENVKTEILTPIPYDIVREGIKY